MTHNPLPAAAALDKKAKKKIDILKSRHSRRDVIAFNNPVVYKG